MPADPLVAGIVTGLVEGAQLRPVHRSTVALVTPTPSVPLVQFKVAFTGAEEAGALPPDGVSETAVCAQMAPASACVQFISSAPCEALATVDIAIPSNHVEGDRMRLARSVWPAPTVTPRFADVKVQSIIKAPSATVVIVEEGVALTPPAPLVASIGDETFTPFACTTENAWT